MYRELNISESEGVLAAFNAVCELKEETERLQAACAAKEAELAGLRAQTAELFGERVAAEGMDADAVTAAKAMWQSAPESAARAVLDCDIAEAANPYGCNQYGHEWKGKHGEGWKPSGRGGASDKKGDTQPKREKAEEPKERGAASNIKDKKVKKIVNEAEKFFKESEEAFRKYQNDKRNPYEKTELLRQWRSKYMDFFAQSRALYKLRHSDGYIELDDMDQAFDYFGAREKEIMKQYDIVLEEIPSFLGKR